MEIICLHYYLLFIHVFVSLKLPNKNSFAFNQSWFKTKLKALERRD